MMFPGQLIRNDLEFFVYDLNQDNIAHFVDEKINVKIPGYLDQNVWSRNTSGYYWNNHIITAIEDPENLRGMDFNNAKSLAFLNLDDYSITKHGILSPTLDNLDANEKYPVILLDEGSEVIYYVFETDYSVMKYDMVKDSSYAVSSYKPKNFRTRTITSGSPKEMGTESTWINGLGIIENQLIVVWQNPTEKYYDNEGDPNGLITYGVIYDLPLLDNPREFSLPGTFLGTYKNNLMVEENDDPIEYTIGFYKIGNEFQE